MSRKTSARSRRAEGDKTKRGNRERRDQAGAIITQAKQAKAEPDAGLVCDVNSVFGAFRCLVERLVWMAPA